MSTYQVRRLTGSYAPSNGSQTLQAVTPSSWMNAATGGNSTGYGWEPWNVIDYWSGGVGDDANSLLYMAGGGHNDASNNGLYVYDFRGSSVPVGPSIASSSQSDISQVGQALTFYTAYSDGKAASRHTYDGIVHTNGKIYLLGGSHYKNGGWGSGGTTTLYRYQSGTWTLMPSPPTGIGLDFEVPLTCFDPVSGKFLASSRGRTMSWCAFYNTNTETWGTLKSTGGNSDLGGYMTLCYDTNRARIVAFGGSCTEVWTPNWTAETVSRSTHPVTGNMANSGVSPVYDAARDVFWLIGGYGSDNWGTLYEVNPVTFASTARTLTGDTIPVRGGGGNWPNGNYKRIVMVANGAALGLVTHFSQPATVIKLP